MDEGPNFGDEVRVRSVLFRPGREQDNLVFDEVVVGRVRNQALRGTGGNADLRSPLPVAPEYEAGPAFRRLIDHFQNAAIRQDGRDGGQRLLLYGTLTS